MGRKKLEIKRIDNKSSRQVTFSKRRNGLIKKAREISVLCEAEVALIIVSARGRRYEFCSTTCLSTVAERYWNIVEQEAGNHKYANAKTAKDERQYSMDTTYTIVVSQSNPASTRTFGQLMQIVQSQLEAIDQLSVNDLVQLEMQLDEALHCIRLQKTQLMMDSISTLKDQEKNLAVQKEVLEREVQQLEKGLIASGKNGFDSGMVTRKFF